MSNKKSYKQILKSTSIIGGASAIVFLLGMLRNKVIAVLMGSSGVGLLTGFTSIQGIISVITGLGVQSSAVREIAIAVSNNDKPRVGRIFCTLNRVCWLNGLAGMMLTIVFSPLLSRITFNSDEYTFDIAAFGLVILLANLASGQFALLQGMRCTNEMARTNIAGSLLGTLSALIVYFSLGLRGIVPSLASIAFFQLVVAWYYVRKLQLHNVNLTWRETFCEAYELIKFGLVFVLSSLLVSAVTFITITLINQKESIHAVGLYSAAFMLSGMSVNFVLGAMGADFYPRLTSVADDKKAINLLINEQTEIGLLLALPALIATLFLAPWLLKIFYTQEFINAYKLIHWFILGCCGRIISWPLGYLMLALGKGKWFVLTEIVGNLIHLTLIYIGLNYYGVEGVAIAFFLSYLAYLLIVYFVSKKLTSFMWTIECLKLALYSIATISLSFFVSRSTTMNESALIGIFALIVIGVLCIIQILKRLEPGTKLYKILSIVKF
jgi:antigen flippase